MLSSDFLFAVVLTDSEPSVLQHCLLHGLASSADFGLIAGKLLVFGHLMQSTSALTRLSGLFRTSRGASAVRVFASEAATSKQNYDPYEVPAGHQNSDLSDVACNISLNRRRDLSLRQDLKVVENGKRASIAEVMRVGSSGFTRMLPRLHQSRYTASS